MGSSGRQERGHADPFAPGTVVAGRYEIKEKLGEGGFGAVFRARHTELGKDVALKVLKPELAVEEVARKRFLVEVEATTSFVHKYAVQLRDSGHDAARGCLYFTMDLVEGLTLRKLLAKENKLEEARASPRKCSTYSRRRTRRASSIAT